jgi:hypothetical protein
LYSGTDVAGRNSSEENVGGVDVGASLNVELGSVGVSLEVGLGSDFSLCKDGIGATDGRSSLWTKSLEGGDDGECSSCLL